jgi:hypothetical protein
MDETTDDNLVQIKPPDLDGGYRQQRYRRKNHHAKSRKTRTAKTSLSDAATTSDSADNVAENGAIAQTRNDDASNNMATLADCFPDTPADHQNTDLVRNEIRAPRRRGGDPESGGNFGASPVNRHDGIDVAALGVAAILAAVAAYFSLNGMVVLFPGTHNAIMVMAGVMEAAKVVTAAWLSAKWRDVSWTFRLLLIALTFGVASINAAGVYSQLVAAHVGPRGAAAAALQTRDADAAARIEVAQSWIADLDRRLAQIDDAVEAATKRGRANGALAVMQDQRKARAALASEREKAERELADIKTERTALAARGRAAEAEAAPIIYVAQLLGIERDAEQIIRWLIAAMVMCCDPLSLVLVVAISARRARPGGGAA